MNKEVKAKWLKALRSGEYVQGDRYLVTVGRDYDEFCCLGVLCDLYIRETDEGGELSKPKKSMLYTKMHRSISDNATSLPKEVMDWAGLEKTDPYIKIRGRSSLDMISWLNDEDRKTFDELADLIEEQL